MDKKLYTNYRHVKNQIKNKRISTATVKDHLRKAFQDKLKLHRSETVDALRCIKTQISADNFTMDLSETYDIPFTEMQHLLEDIERELCDELHLHQVAVYEDYTLNYIDHMLGELITCRRCGISTHKSSYVDNKCYSCGFEIIPEVYKY